MCGLTRLHEQQVITDRLCQEADTQILPARDPLAARGMPLGSEVAKSGGAQQGNNSAATTVGRRGVTKGQDFLALGQR